jgi:aminodeoxyfutalosine deaminase
MLLRARWVIPVDRPPIKNGAIRLDGTRIAEVGSAKTVEGGPVVEFVDAAICPGLVNAHTHLELTHLEGRVPPSPDFIGWLERLRATMLEDSEPDETATTSARDGARQSLQHGVTTVGDITARASAVRSVLNHGPLRVVSFGEVIATGRIRDQLPTRLQAAIDGAYVSEFLSIAVSPHAPYTIEPDGIRACAEAAERLEMRICMHAAETRDERQYTERGDGAFRHFLEGLGLVDDLIVCPELAPVPLLRSCGVLGRRTLLAHCNYVDEDDMRTLASTRTHVAYCPRTHAAFAHDPHKFREMLSLGINVCVGTDSLASNPSLSVLDELRFLHAAFDDFDLVTLLRMGTINGATALGLQETIGTLEVGKAADLAVIPLDASGPSDPIRNILTSSLAPQTTFVRGRSLTTPP